MEPPSSWEVWTELVIPSVAAFGSILVAVVALVVTLRSAAQDRRARAREAAALAEERARRARADMLPVFDAYLQALSDEPLVEGPGDAIMRIYDHGASVPGGQEVASWVRSAAAAAKFKLQSEAKSPTAMKDVKFAVRATILARLRRWVESGDLDRSSLVAESGDL